jgi:hypothetical protein
VAAPVNKEEVRGRLSRNTERDTFFKVQRDLKKILEFPQKYGYFIKILPERRKPMLNRNQIALIEPVKTFAGVVSDIMATSVSCTPMGGSRLY